MKDEGYVPCSWQLAFILHPSSFILSSLPLPLAFQPFSLSAFRPSSLAFLTARPARPAPASARGGGGCGSRRSPAASRTPPRRCPTRPSSTPPAPARDRPPPRVASA